MNDRRGTMKANGAVSGKIGWLLKSLLAAYALTGVLLLVLAMILYKLNVGENVVSAGIIGIYVTSTFFGGLIIGKLAKVRRFFWGLILGVSYFLLLLLITLGVYRSLDGAAAGFVSTFFLCAGGGMFGGMIS